MTTQQSFGFNEDAPLWIERVLADLQNVCAVHIGTTLDGGNCAICDLEARLMDGHSAATETEFSRVNESEPEYGWTDAITGLPIDVP
jgi:hypothetical protein